MNGFNIVKEIGRSFIISSFIPAALFVFVIILLFIGFVPPQLLLQLETFEALLILSGVSFTVVTLWLSLFLYSSVDWIIKIYEGFYFPRIIQMFFMNILQKEFRNQTWHYQAVRHILAIDIEERSINDIEHYEKLWPYAVGEIAYLGWLAPLHESLIMPTRLGNILRATSEYALNRYHIEHNEIWPRLVDLLPEKFLKAMEEKNSQLTFTLNSSFLLNMIGFVCLITGIIGFSLSWIPRLFVREVLFIERGFATIYPVVYLLIAAVLLAIGYLLYRVAVNTTLEFSSFYRTGIDLYRLELLKKLNYKLPENLKEEQRLWQEISTFFIAGETLSWNPDTFNLLPYNYEMDKTSQSNSKRSSKQKTNWNFASSFLLLFAVLIVKLMRNIFKSKNE